MRKAVLLSILSVMLLATKSDAQHFITSFGVTHSWGMPYEVVYAIEHDYWGYDIVHTSRIVQRGKVFFDIVLQRGDVFVSVNIGSTGRVFRRAVTYEYPFYNHVCNDFCGYHDLYYRNHRTVCGSHHHHGHNHVVYTRPYYHNDRPYAYGKYKQGYKNGYKQGKKNNNYGYGHNDQRRDANASKTRPSVSRDSRSTSRVAEGRESGGYGSRSTVSASRGSSDSESTSSNRSRTSTSASGRSSTVASGRRGSN